MIFNPLLTTVDNEPDDRTDEAPKSSHISGKELRIIVIAVVTLGLILWPIYNILRQDSERHICRSNMVAISRALSLYMADNDNQLPPTHQRVPGSEDPVVEGGAAVTWITSVSQYMDPKKSFVCPSAKEEEYVLNQAFSDQRGTYVIPSTYGLYSALNGVAVSSIANQEDVIMLSETSNHGAMGTYDPVPLGEFDGFAISWDTSNVWPTDQTEFVTRLAFYGSQDGFERAVPRHRQGLHFFRVDGSLETMGPEAAEVAMRQGQLVGRWATPPSAARPR